MVLAREGVAPLPTSDVSVIVSSRVPEGKGVSSSASVEVREEPRLNLACT